MSMAEVAEASTSLDSVAEAFAERQADAPRSNPPERRTPSARALERVPFASQAAQPG